MARMSDEGTWPVTNEDPLDLVTEPGLTPGPSLISCSGSDIQLSKGASARPNAAKQKGRYVLMLPGMMSFRSQHSKEKKHEATNGSDNNGIGDMNETGRDNDNKELNPSAKLANTSSLLGRIEGLTSGRPTLSIPFPNGGTLTLKGQHIESSSRFMMLNFKRGKVTCKDAVSSVLVFGEPIWSGNEHTPCREDPKEAPLEHYGGSERTVDGGRDVKLRKSRNAPIFVKQSATQPDTKPETKPVSRRTPAINGGNSQLVDSGEDEESSDAYEEEDAGTFALRDTAESSRRSSRACAGKKISYDDKGSEEEISEEESLEEESSKDVSKEKPTRRRRKKPQQINKKSSKPVSSKENSINLIDLDQDNDDSDCYHEDDSINLPCSQTSGSNRRSSRARKRISYGDKGSEDDESSEEQSSEGQKEAQKENSTSGGGELKLKKGAAGTTKCTISKKTQSTSKGARPKKGAVGTTKCTISKKTQSTSKGARAKRQNVKKTAKDKTKREEIIEVDDPQSRNKTVLTAKNGRSSLAATNTDEDDEGDKRSILPKRKVAKDWMSTKSPGRRRRRRSGGLATPSSCNHDAVPKVERKNEGFNFDFSEEDKAIMTTPEKKRMKR